MRQFASPTDVERINLLYAAAESADAGRLEYADHVRSLATWYAYAYYLSLVRAYQPDRNAVILDWGGQFGHVTALYQAEYPNTLCYVADQDDLLRYWQTLFGTKNVVLRADTDTMATISLPLESVDAALSSGVLEHTYEYGVKDSDALKELWRVLKPGGKLFIYHLPTQYGLPEIVNKMIGRWYHERRYGREQIRKLLHDAGFTILFLDKHELLFPKMRNALGRLIGQQNAFWVDYWFSKVPGIAFFAEHFTIVAEKPAV